MRSFPLYVEGEEKPQYWIFRANHRAWHTIERVASKGVLEWLSELGQARTLGPWHELAWALSSTHREKMANPPSYDDFLDLLPTGDQWKKFVILLSQIISEAFPAEAAPPKKATTPTMKTKPSRRRGSSGPGASE